MAREIHPMITPINVKCSGCGNNFQVSTTIKTGGKNATDVLDIEVCYRCHPVYTGQRRASTTGRAELFAKKFAGFDQFTNTSGSKDNPK
tara:strand:- start:4420 stop:4686 length:267 start_codon:yes stop_codon:yes gene_type:complete